MRVSFLVTGANKKWHPLLIGICLLDAAISLIIMRIILSMMGVQVNAERSDNHAFQAVPPARSAMEALGSVLISTVIRLADRFLFTLRDGFVLSAAIVSALFFNCWHTRGSAQMNRHRTAIKAPE